MINQGYRNGNSLREEAKLLYRHKDNIHRKWLERYGSVSRDNDYQQNRACLSELFNMLDIVMEICIEDFRHAHAILSIENGDRGAVYTFAGDDGSEVRFNAPNTFALRVRALRAIGYNISDELFYDTRILRNETIHGNQTVVLQHIELGYEETLKALSSIADTLIILGKLDESLRTPTFEMMRIHEGDTLHNGAFMIGALIGEGGMSRVYKASQKRTGRTLAVKEMKPGNYKEELIRHEGDMLMLLHHQQIPQVHDTFFENGTYYIVMDYIEGTTLERFINSRTMSGNELFLHNETEEFNISPDNLDTSVAETLMSEIERREFIRALLDILSYLHSPEVGLVFIDLSPNNIIVDENILPHLIDFGLAGRLGTEQVVPAATIGYAAPEVLAKSTLDERTDIYSFGYILRYLYTGLTPLERTEDSTRELIDDEHIAEVVNRCTARNPEERYVSIDDLIMDLFPEGLDTSRDSFILKHKKVLAIAGAVVALGVSLLVYRSQQHIHTLNMQQQKTAAENTLLKEELLQNDLQQLSFEDSGLTDHVIEWKDDALEYDMRIFLGRVDGEIMLSEIWDYIKSESGELELKNNNIRDISALSEIKIITSLKVPDSSIEDISFLENLPYLSSLDLSGNPISEDQIKAIIPKMSFLHSLSLNNLSISGSLDFLSGLKSLESLSVNNNRITDISGLVGLSKLSQLDLSGNNISESQIREIVPQIILLRKLYLNDLSLTGNLDFLSGLVDLMELTVANNQITDISTLVDLSKISYLDLSGNSIPESQIRKILSQKDKLQALYLDDLSLTGDLEFLSGLSNLMELSVANNQITDISALKEIWTLFVLNLSGNSIPEFQIREILQTLFLSRLFLNDLSLSGNLDFLSGSNSLKELSVANNQITDISALEDLSELSVLDLSGNNISEYQIRDIIPQKNQLQWLLLNDLNITGNLDFLSGMENLETLSVVNNQITDISALEDLSGLSILDLSGNCIPEYQIREIIPQKDKLRELNLESLNLSGDLDFLAELKNLEYLLLRDNQITDISTLECLSELSWLDLSGNSIPGSQIRKILSQKDTLRWLYLESLNLSGDLDFLSGLRSLEYLSLKGNQITDISALEDMSELSYLNLSDNSIPESQIKDIISQKFKLQQLSIENLSLSGDLDFLSRLKNLKELSVENNQITDISALEGLSELSVLDLSGNSIPEFQVKELISQKSKLRMLKLNNLDLSGDLEFLSGLTSLELLDIYNNRITDISALKDFYNLSMLDITENYITDFSVLSDKTIDNLYIKPQKK